MKFYIISAALNAAFLFIPVVVPVINNMKQDNVPVITVNLENSTFEEIKEGKAEESENTEEKQETENDTKKDKNEKKIEKPVFQEKKVIEVKTSNSENKVKADENKFTKTETANSQPVPTLNTGSGEETSSKSKNGGIESKSISSEGKGGESRQGQNIKREPGGNVCRENIDYTVTYNPDLQYPVAAERLGIKKTVIVNVRVNFNGNGSVSVIGASGGEGMFQSEAKKAAGKIKVKIKNPETLKCTITKPFRFNPR